MSCLQHLKNINFVTGNFFNLNLQDAQDDIAHQAQTQGLQAKLNQATDKLGNNLEHVKDKVTSYFNEPVSPRDNQISQPPQIQQNPEPVSFRAKELPLLRIFFTILLKIK